MFLEPFIYIGERDLINIFNLKKICDCFAVCCICNYICMLLVCSDYIAYPISVQVSGPIVVNSISCKAFFFFFNRVWKSLDLFYSN